MVKTLAILAAVAIGLVALDRLMLWMERRGWVFWRKRKRPDGGGGGLAGVLTEFQALVEPQVRHVIEDREERKAVRLDRPAGGAVAKDPSRGDTDGP